MAIGYALILYASYRRESFEKRKVSRSLAGNKMNRVSFHPCL